MTGTATSGTDLRRVLPWMAGAILSFTVMAVAVRETGRTLGIFEVLALRNLLTVAVLLPTAFLLPSLRGALRPRSMGWHLLRNVVQGAGQYAWALAVVLLPLAQVFALEFATPLLTAALAVLLLRERITRFRVASVAAGVVGVVVIHGGAVGVSGWASALPLAAALCFAASDIVTKRLTRTETAFAIVFWMNAIQLPMNLAGSEWGFWTKLDWQIAPAVLAVCVSGSFGHYALTQALRHGDAVVVVPLDFLRIPLVAVLGWILYGEGVGPELLAGSSILAAGVLLGLWAETRGRRDVAAEPRAGIDPQSEARPSPEVLLPGGPAFRTGSVRPLGHPSAGS